MYNNSQDIKKIKDSFLLVILCLFVYRVGCYIPLPGIDPKVLSELFAKNSGGILGIFNMLSGGSIGRMSILALGLMPYITSSIVVQLFSFINKDLDSLRKDGEIGKRKLNQITRFLTIFLSIVQAFGIANGMLALSASQGQLVIIEPSVFMLLTVCSLTTGTFFLMWLGETISRFGLGNGTSIIIFASIVSGIPSALGSLFELGRTGAMSFIELLFILSIAILLVLFVVFVEKSFRKVQVQYSNRQVGNKIYKGDSTYLPIKINISGVIPPIFASSILLFPLTIMNFYSNVDQDSFMYTISLMLGHGKPLYILLYSLFIIFFAFFYTSVVFNPEETAENIKKNGGFFPGRRPGKASADYLDFIVTRLTFVGAVYLCLICLLPEIIIAKFGVSLYLGGTSILIVISVVIDCMTQIQSKLFYNKYSSMVKKLGFKS